MTEPAASGPPSGEPEAATSDLLALRYAKTEAGRTEIRQRALPLTRPARNLLLIIDPGRPASDWLGLVQGCDRAAWQALRDSGLIAPTSTGEPARAAPMAAAATDANPAPPRMSLAQALEHRSPDALAARITAEARQRLGMIKGYRLALEVERCRSPAEVRAVAQRFVDQVRDREGDIAGMALAQVLIAPE